MSYGTKDMSGSLFKNSRKEKESHPDYTGSCRIAGHDYWQSCWLKTDKNGNKYMSFSYKLKDGTAARPEQQKGGGAKQSFNRDLDDSDVPF